MKRYPANGQVQFNGIEVMKKMSTISPLLVETMLKKGVTRQLISKLADEFSSKTTLIKSIELLNSLADVNQNALQMMSS